MNRWARLARVLALVALVAVLISSSQACRSTPTGPGDGSLPNGRWAGEVGCLSVADTGCDFVAGCAHGRFPKPVVQPDGRFEVDGTYRIEAGPVSIDPAPPAHFSGSLTNSTLLLTVTPTAPLPAASYSLRRTTAGTCQVPCV